MSSPAFKTKYPWYQSSGVGFQPYMTDGCIYHNLASYVHVTIDTFSSMIWTMPLSGETTNYVITHLFEAFAVLGMPTIIKTMGLHTPLQNFSNFMNNRILNM